ncbi:hypothetical protein XcodCFBP4690_01150 [Xanthomonas codiaei]|uniref:Uncharacterized protein n=1 Tax=Xanthomonas codiaei TaxID=56463 RepID=A0A2S7CYW4_9XANT|nr:hypothetical protein XcodCFBP4690_01150 [Xanthomonas codiaei]
MRTGRVHDADVLDRGVPDDDASSRSTLDNGVCGARLVLTIMQSHPDMTESGSLRQGIDTAE